LDCTSLSVGRPAAGGCPAKTAASVSSLSAVTLPPSPPIPPPCRRQPRRPVGRFAPAGPGAGLWFSRTCRSTGQCPARAGETRVAFPVPARNGEGTVNASMAGAIAPATAPGWPLSSRGPKAPGQRPPRPWRALLARRVWRWPAFLSDLPVRLAPCRAGGETRVAFPRPEWRSCALRDGRSLWQGPSPLPQRCADPCPAGGPKPPASARPAPAGAGLCPSRTHRATGHRCAWVGETRVAFPDPGHTDESTFIAAMAGAIAPATAQRRDQGQLGAQSPRPAPAPPPAGAGLRSSRTRRSAGHRRAGAGERRVAFPDPACRAIPSPGPGRVSRQTSGRIAVSALCSSAP